MRFEAKTGHATKQKTACLVLPVYSSGALPASAKSVNAATNGLIANLLEDGDIEGKVGDALLVKPPQNQGQTLLADRILLIGCGDRKKFDRKQYRKAIRVAFGALRKTCRSLAPRRVSLHDHEDQRQNKTHRTDVDRTHSKSVPGRSNPQGHQTWRCHGPGHEHFA